MDDDNSKPFEDQDSFLSRLSSNRSIDRFSERLSHRSLSAKPSMVEVLDLDGIRGRKSSSGRLSQGDDDSQSRILKFSSNSFKDLDSNSFAEERYQMFQEIPNFTQNNLEYSRHQCSCTKQVCSHISCPCMFAINELCVVGLCCQGCIQKKNFSLANESALKFENKQKKHHEKHKQKRQNHHLKSIKKAHRAKVQKQKYDFVYCTCKKTQCLKKYCPCFALNKQCNECCICQDCHNCSESESESEQFEGNFPMEGANEEGIDGGVNEMKAELLDEEIDNYFEQSPENYDNVELNKAMDFEPVDFTEFQK